MRFAEVFLRLGSALVAWMMLYAYFLWLAAVYVMGCGPDGDEMHRLLLGMAPFICGCAFVLGATRPLEEIQSMLRWLALPLALLLPFALRSIWQVIQVVNIENDAICADTAPTAWQLLWAPTHVVTLAVVSYMLARVWRTVSLDRRKAAQELEQSD